MAKENLFWLMLKLFGEAQIGISFERGCKNQTFEVMAIQCLSKALRDSAIVLFLFFLEAYGDSGRCCKHHNDAEQGSEKVRKAKMRSGGESGRQQSVS